MMKKKITACFFAVAAAVLLPLQQYFVHRAALQKQVEKTVDKSTEEQSISALHGNAGAIMHMVMFQLRQGDPAAAEAWLKLGTMQFQAPSVMLFYGDWLRQHREYRRAEYLYRFALRKAVSENAPERFIREVKKRLETEK